MATRRKKKRVQFFEVRDAHGVELVDPLPWDEVLADISQESPDERKHSISGTDHWGQTYTLFETDHLLLARHREDAVSSYDVTTGEIIDLESDVATPWVEISVIHFLPRTNKLGFVLGSQAAPRASALEDWINAHEVYDKQLTVAPLISPNALAKIGQADEASLLRLQLTADQVAAVHDEMGLFGAFTAVKSETGNVEVDLVLRVRGRVSPSHQDERQRILAAAQEAVSRPFEKAIVDVINYDADGRVERESINVLNHLIAKKMDVSVTDEEGNPIRIESAITAIYRAVDALRAELLN